MFTVLSSYKNKKGSPYYPFAPTHFKFSFILNKSNYSVYILIYILHFCIPILYFDPLTISKASSLPSKYICYFSVSINNVHVIP